MPNSNRKLEALESVMREEPYWDILALATALDEHDWPRSIARKHSEFISHISDRLRQSANVLYLAREALRAASGDTIPAPAEAA